MTTEAVYLVLGVYPHDDGLENFYLGKLWRNARYLSVLEDRQGLLEGMDGDITPRLERRFRSLSTSGYTMVVPRPLAHGVSMTTEDSGKDTVRDVRLDESIARLRALSREGKLSADALQEIETALFRDELVPTIGNERAYRDHLATARAVTPLYVHLQIDPPIRPEFDARASRACRDETEQAAGRALRSAIDEVLGAEHVDVWHVTGPHYVVAVQTTAQVSALENAVCTTVAALPHIAGGPLTVGVRVSVP